MNTPQQKAIVKEIIKIKKRIVHSSDPDHIVGLIQHALDVCANVPANANLDRLDKTQSKEWNFLALKHMIKGISGGNFESTEELHTEVSAALLRLSMVFVQGELDDVNSILADSFLNRDAFIPKPAQSSPSHHDDDE